MFSSIFSKKSLENNYVVFPFFFYLTIALTPGFSVVAYKLYNYFISLKIHGVGEGAQRDSTELVLHETTPGSIPGTTYGPLSTIRTDPEHKAKHYAQLVWPNTPFHPSFKKDEEKAIGILMVIG